MTYIASVTAVVEGPTQKPFLGLYTHSRALFGGSSIHLAFI